MGSELMGDVAVYNSQLISHLTLKTYHLTLTLVALSLVREVAVLHVFHIVIYRVYDLFTQIVVVAQEFGFEAHVHA